MSVCKVTVLLPRLIHFFGPDGAGKSTQVGILVAFLETKGVHAKKCWVRSPHTLAFLLWKLFIKVGFYRVVLNPFGIAIKLPAVNQSRLLSYFWSLVEFVGVLPLILRVHLSMLSGHTVVAERFILDTVTTVAYFLNDRNFLKGFLSKVLLHFIPEDTVFIFLDSDFETIMRRRECLFRAQDCTQNASKSYGSLPNYVIEPRDFIEFQRVAYRAFAQSFNAFVVDTSKLSIEQTSDSILRYLRLR